MKILIVEDDAPTSLLLSKTLTAHRYAVDVAVDGQTALELATTLNYDLILLDLLIPEVDGISVCRQLRSQGLAQPILLLTAKDSTQDMIAGLDAGADDYVTKPCDVAQLLARIRALLRRGQTLGTDRPTQAIEPILSWENLQLNPTSAQVTYAQQAIALTPKEYGLLELFLRHPLRVLSRSAIIDHLWSIDTFPTENAVTNLIKDLRRKLKAAGMNADLIETVYGLGYRLKPVPAAGSEQNSAQKDDRRQASAHPIDRQQGIAAIERVLERYRQSFQQQIDSLEAAEAALRRQDLSSDLWQQSTRTAHKLAGSLGTFGYAEGSTLARAIEHLLERSSAPTATQPSASVVSRFSKLLADLKHQLTLPPTAFASSEVQPSAPLLLVVNNDIALVERLQQEAAHWSLQMEVAYDLPTARQRLTHIKPDAVLLDLMFPGSQESGLTLLQELKAQFPKLPVVTLAAEDTLADRIAVARLGGERFVLKPITPKQVFEAIVQVLPQAHSTEAKVLVVDDDPVTLTVLKKLLQPWGVQVAELAQPDQFWQVLRSTNPDLLILDLEIPTFSGIELCQVVRQDAEWGDVPILVVTAHTDTELIQQVFAAGADDFIRKPVIGPELVTRVLSRIERSRLRQQLDQVRQRQTQTLQRQATIDALTQIANRRYFDERLGQEWQRLRREQAPLALLLCDIDYFKKYNDRYGHPAGDSCLQQIARAIRKVVQRPTDLVARYGGEEFGVILPYTTDEGAVHVAKKLQHQIAALDLSYSDRLTAEPVTVSIGITSTIPQADRSSTQLLRAADQALYAAKAQGRNTYSLRPL